MKVRSNNFMKPCIKMMNISKRIKTKLKYRNTF